MTQRCATRQGRSYPISLNGMNSTLKCIVLMILIGSLALPTLRAQDRLAQPDSDVISSKIDLLFDAMRANDSTTITDLFVDGATLSSIFTEAKSGKVVKKSSPAARFITAIGMPHDGQWDERLSSKEVKVDGAMGLAWTDYSFYVDGEFSHCGVNVFEFMNTEAGWQISSITDTRRKDNCGDAAEADIESLLNGWHQAAAEADETVFFGSMLEGGIYIGTDASERWTREEMLVLLGKYFERESAWDFKTIERNITMADDDRLAWFDELLDTWMGTCRASGVVQLINGRWYISHYHLSIAVPNDVVDGYLELIGKTRED